MEMSKVRWHSLWDESEWGEVVARDVAELSVTLCREVTKRGLYLRLRDRELYKELLYYVWLRLNGKDASHICIRRVAAPTDWDAKTEQIWVEWLLTFKMNDEFWRSVFVRNALWEEGCRGWREDLTAFLPYWIERDWNLFSQIDPTPIELPDQNAEIRAALEASDRDRMRRL